MKYVTHHGLRRDVVRRQGGRLADRARSRDRAADVNMNMMADARVVDAEDAGGSSAARAPTCRSTARWTPSSCEASSPSRSRSTRRRWSAHAGRQPECEPDGPPAFGPRNLADGDAGVLGNNTTHFVFPMGDVWKRGRRRHHRAPTQRACANRSRAATTSSSSARSGSATRCTSTRSASATRPSAPARPATACT